MLSQRYALIQQRLLRHELFRPSNLGQFRQQQRQQQQQHKLTPIESLLGKNSSSMAGGGSVRTILLLAVLVQIEEGRYYLEDPTGQLPVSFQFAKAVDGFFVTEHCILLVEGSFQDGVLYAHRLGHPLLEKRADSLSAIQQQVSHPAFSSYRDYDYAQHSNRSKLGGGGFGVDEDSKSFVVLSDLYLDQPRVLQHVEGLLASYENYSPNRLPVFVLMGNFSSQASFLGGDGGTSTSSSAVSSGSRRIGNHHSGGSNSSSSTSIEELGSLLSSFTTLAQHAHFVIVPGPRDDATGHVLPHPNMLSRQGFSRVQNVHWATNPCRIRNRGREMVVFRYDLLHLLQRQQVLLQQGNVLTYDEENGGLEDEDQNFRRLPHCRLVKTILDQGHLVPVAGVPIYWNYNHALSLFPLPDVLVLGGDDHKEGFHEVYGGCHVVHPGSVSRNANYATFSWTDHDRDGDNDSDNMEDDDHQSDGEHGGVTVQFGQLGEQTD